MSGVRAARVALALLLVAPGLAGAHGHEPPVRCIPSHLSFLCYVDVGRDGVPDAVFLRSGLGQGALLWNVDAGSYQVRGAQVHAWPAGSGGIMAYGLGPADPFPDTMLVRAHWGPTGAWILLADRSGDEIPDLVVACLVECSPNIVPWTP